MSITVAEKTHWKERIAQKIERAIKELVAKHDPQYLENTARLARHEVIESLGGAQLVNDLNDLEEQKKDLQVRIERIHEQLAALATKSGVKPKSYYYNSHDDLNHWNTAIERRQDAAEKKLLLQDSLGQRILKLRDEQESLLDTVWLSTSTVQIRELWKSVSDLLSDETTELQQKVLTQPAIKQEGAK